MSKSNLENIFTIVDTHTAGHPTRSILTGYPKLVGHTIAEKMAYFEEHCDWIRTVTMQEPRGNPNMSGTVILEPCDPTADFGVFYLNASGYMPMCGHSTIGCTTALIETGRIQAVEPVTHVVLDTPAGLVRVAAHVQNGQVVSATFRNVPAFLYAAKTIETEAFGPLDIEVAYGGNAYAILAAEKVGLSIPPENFAQVFQTAQIIRDAANKQIGFQHPEKPFINWISHVHFYGPPLDPAANYKDMVVLLPGEVDRSPCGTGTSARVAALYAKGELKINQEFVQESVIGSLFKARIVEETKVGDFPAVVPEITGSAYITGLLELVVDPKDPFRRGFLLV